MDIPSLSNTFSILGLTFIKPNTLKSLYTLFNFSLSDFYKSPPFMLRHITLSHGFYGFGEALTLPPNFIPLGITIS